MAVTTSLELKFGDGDYLFALPLPQLAELQRLRSCGVFKLYGRILKGRFVLGEQIAVVPEEGEAFAEDILDTIRLGLIGGGKGMVNGQEATVSAIRARQLVDTYCYPSAPLRESWAVAAAILTACVEGFDPPKGKKKARSRTARQPAT